MNAWVCISHWFTSLVYPLPFCIKVPTNFSASVSSSACSLLCPSSKSWRTSSSFSQHSLRGILPMGDSCWRFNSLPATDLPFWGWTFLMCDSSSCWWILEILELVSLFIKGARTRLWGFMGVYVYTSIPKFKLNI